MKKFEMPEIMVEVFAIEDVITTSGDVETEGTMCQNQTGLF